MHLPVLLFVIPVTPGSRVSHLRFRMLTIALFATRYHGSCVALGLGTQATRSSEKWHYLAGQRKCPGLQGHGCMLGRFCTSCLHRTFPRWPVTLQHACAASKKGAATGLKFEAEATGHLQKTGVPVTDDQPKYQPQDAGSTLLAILSATGFVQSTEVCSAFRVLQGFKGFPQFFQVVRFLVYVVNPRDVWSNLLAEAGESFCHL